MTVPAPDDTLRRPPLHAGTGAAPSPAATDGAPGGATTGDQTAHDDATQPRGAAAAPGSVLVLGAGLAGARTVAQLRAHGFGGRVTIVGDEPIAPYDRPPLSKHLLDRPSPVWLADDLDIRLSELADDVRLGVGAVGLDVLDDAAHAAGGSPGYRATLAGGEHVDADAVVLATGSRPVVPPGWDAALTLHSADDAERLRARLAAARADADRTGRAPRVLCVGAGWIGAELSGVLAASGVDVTVVEAARTPLASALGHRAGALTAHWYDEHEHLRLETGALVAAVRADGVDLADGRTLEADAVVVAIGARPATAWLGGSLAGRVALLGDGSVRVDEEHVPIADDGTRIPGLERVRVVGDVARRRSARHGWVPGGHWGAALTGPETAVRSLLGLPGDVPDPAPYVFSTQHGHELSMFGVPAPGDDVVVRAPEPPGADGWTVLWFAQPGTTHPRGSQDDGGRADGGQDDHGRAGRGPGRVLTAVLTVDRPRDVGAARRLFAGPTLPVLDPQVARDASVRLQAAVVTAR